MDALGHLAAFTREKFQRLIISAGCGATVVDEPVAKRCRFCDHHLGKPYGSGSSERPAASLIVWHEASEKSLHVCTERECVLKAANRFHEYREELDKAGE